MDQNNTMSGARGVHTKKKNKSYCVHLKISHNGGKYMTVNDFVILIPLEYTRLEAKELSHILANSTRINKQGTSRFTEEDVHIEEIPELADLNESTIKVTIKSPQMVEVNTPTGRHHHAHTHKSEGNVTMGMREAVRPLVLQEEPELEKPIEEPKTHTVKRKIVITKPKAKVEDKPKAVRNPYLDD
jgi:hypothetical protein